MNLRNMEKLHRYKFTEHQRTATGLSFSANKKTKRKHLEHQRGSFFLECKSMSQLGMVLVSSHFQLCSRGYYPISMLIPLHLSETESENEFRPLDDRIDEFHPKATRTLFIGNLEKTTTYHDLLNIFQRFGEIVVSYYF